MSVGAEDRMHMLKRSPRYEKLLAPLLERAGVLLRDANIDPQR